MNSGRDCEKTMRCDALRQMTPWMAAQEAKRRNTAADKLRKALGRICPVSIGPFKDLF